MYIERSLCAEETVAGRVARIVELTPDLDNGATVYKSAGCEACHADTGVGVPTLGSDLTASGCTYDVTIETIITGTPDATPRMPALGELSDQDIADIAAYSLTFQN